MQRRDLMAVMLLAAVIAFVTAIGTAAETQSPDQPKTEFWMDDKTVDVGTVQAGDDVVATFVFHNDSEEEVQILSAKPS